MLGKPQTMGCFFSTIPRFDNMKHKPAMIANHHRNLGCVWKIEMLLISLYHLSPNIPDDQSQENSEISNHLGFFRHVKTRH